MKKLFYWVGVVLSIALAAYFIHFAVNALKQYELEALLMPDLLLAIAVAALLYALCIPISGWAWHVLLRGMGITWRPENLAAIMGVTQLAKYLPGNVGQHIGRTALALARGMSVGAYASSVLTETVLAMSAGLFVGLVFILLSPAPVSNVIVEYRLTLGLMAGGLILCALALPWVIRKFDDLIRRHPIGVKWQTHALTSPGHAAVGLAFLGYCLNYVVIGVGLWSISLTAGGHIQADFFYLTAIFALSWLLGFMTPGAPAGLGVREGMMALLLSGLGSSDAVLLVITAMRVATIAGDGLVFILSALYIRLNPFVNNT